MTRRSNDKIGPETRVTTTLFVVLLGCWMLLSQTTTTATTRRMVVHAGSVGGFQPGYQSVWRTNRHSSSCRSVFGGHRRNGPHSCTTVRWSSSSPSDDDNQDDDETAAVDLAALWKSPRPQQLPPRQQDLADDIPEYNEDDKESPSSAVTPTTGISLSDELDSVQQQAAPESPLGMVTQLLKPWSPSPNNESNKSVPLSCYAPLETHPRDATVVAWEPLRYLVALQPSTPTTFALVDIPPYSESLVRELKQYMKTYNTPLPSTTTTTAPTDSMPHPTNKDDNDDVDNSDNDTMASWLVAILITSNRHIHMDEEPTQVYS